MTAPIVTEYNRQPIDLYHPTVSSGPVSGDRVASWPRVPGELWQRLAERNGNG